MKLRTLSIVVLALSFASAVAAPINVAGKQHCPKFRDAGRRLSSSLGGQRSSSDQNRSYRKSAH